MIKKYKKYLFNPFTFTLIVILTIILLNQTTANFAHSNYILSAILGLVSIIFIILLILLFVEYRKGVKSKESD